jgi:hypothetical protein
MFVWKEKLN